MCESGQRDDMFRYSAEAIRHGESDHSPCRVNGSCTRSPDAKISGRMLCLCEVLRCFPAIEHPVLADDTDAAQTTIFRAPGPRFESLRMPPESRHVATTITSPGVSSASNTSHETRPAAFVSTPSDFATSSARLCLSQSGEHFASSSMTAVPCPVSVTSRRCSSSTSPAGNPVVGDDLADAQAIVGKHPIACGLHVSCGASSACASARATSRRASSTARAAILRASGLHSGCCR